MKHRIGGVTRRAAFAQAGVAAIAGASSLQPGVPARNTLSARWPASRVASALLSREDWRPFPLPADRPAWLAVPEDLRQTTVRRAERLAKGAWPSLPASIFLEFRREGNRSNYERINFDRRRRLKDLVLAEAIDRQGRFVEAIVDGLWVTLEETFWGLPAHLSAQKAGPGLPDVSEPIVDLFAAETAAELAWADYLLGPELDQISPLLRKRISFEIDRRILTPCQKRDFGWMGFTQPERVNNWNPWICSNWLTALLLIETNPARRAEQTSRIITVLDHFLNVYHDDGGCDEGPGYWGRAGASLFETLELLHSASAGKLDAYDIPLVAEIGRYIYRAHIDRDWYLNFADASAKNSPPAALIYRYGKAIGDTPMREFGGWLFAREEAKTGATERGIDSLSREMATLFESRELRATPGRAPLVRDVWLPGIQVMAARIQGGSAQGLYVAAQGGHNAESHNHNDVGNFVVFVDGFPMLVDAGVETYTAKTFSSKRYDIWTMQSAYHNVPTVGGVMQSPGREFAASRVSYRSSDQEAVFSLDIAKAYPRSAGLTEWLRTIRLDRQKSVIELMDRYRLARVVQPIELNFLTPCKLEPGGPGQIRFSAGAFFQFDPQQVSVQTDDVQVDDARLTPVWGSRLHRIRLVAANPGLEATLSLQIRLLR